MRPYFSAGEEVILCSKSLPEYNGEYVVEKILHEGLRHVCRISGQEFIVSEGQSYFSYILDEAIPSDAHFQFYDIGFMESALRKKHKPSDQSFSELIKSTREIKV